MPKRGTIFLTGNGLQTVSPMQIMISQKTLVTGHSSPARTVFIFPAKTRYAAMPHKITAKNGQLRPIYTFRHSGTNRSP